MVYVKYVIREMFQKTYVIRDLNENRLVIRDRDPLYHPVLSWKLSTLLLKMLSYTPRTVNWNYHLIVQRPRWRGMFVESVT